MAGGKVREQPVIFDKGLNTSVTDVGSKLHPVTMDNVWLSRDDRGGAVEQIPGYSLFHTFADNDVAIQSIGSAGIKYEYFSLYGLGGTKFYRYILTNPVLGAAQTDNSATKTGLEEGQMGSIFIYGDVDGTPHAWVFNGVDSPFFSQDKVPFTTSGAYNVSDIGVDRPYADDYAVGDATDRIYIVAGDADAGPSVQKFTVYDGGSHTDDTTDANDDGTGDVALGPSSGWSAADKDGFFVASDTPFGGLAFEGYTPQTGGTPTAKYKYQYWNGVGWQTIGGLSDGTAVSGVGFVAAAGDVEVTWTTPTNWAKSKETVGGSAVGPFYWVRCVKTAGVIGSSTGATCARVYLLNQTFGEDEAEGILNYYLSKLDGTAESALSSPLYQADGTQGIDAGVGGTVKIVIDKSDAGGVGDDPNAADYYDSATFKVYRTYQDGSQPYDTGLRIETSASGAGEIEDNVPDDELGNLPYLHGDPPPDTAHQALAHFGRIFCADPSQGSCRVYWSDLANPESFWTEDNGSYAEVFKGDGDEISCLARDRDGILVFKKNHLYKINGRTPDQFYLTEVTLSDPNAAGVGTPSMRSLCYTPYGIVFYWNKAVYLYDGSYPRKISSPIDQDLRAIDSKDEESGVCIGYYGHRNQVYLSVPLGGSTPSHTYIFDLDVGEWSGRLTAGFRQFLSVKIDADTRVTTLQSETGERFLGVSTGADGKVYELDTGTAFESATIDSGLTLSPFFGSSLNKLKTFLYVDVIFEPVAGGALDVEWWINGESGDSTTTEVSLVSSGYSRARRRVNIGYKGRDLTVKINNNSGYTGSWKVYGLVIGYIEHESYSL